MGLFFIFIFVPLSTSSCNFMCQQHKLLPTFTVTLISNKTGHHYLFSVFFFFFNEYSGCVSYLSCFCRELSNKATQGRKRLCWFTIVLIWPIMRGAWSRWLLVTPHPQSESRKRWMLVFCLLSPPNSVLDTTSCTGTHLGHIFYHNSSNLDIPHRFAQRICFHGDSKSHKVDGQVLHLLNIFLYYAF